MLKIVERPVTVHDCLKMKKHNPFSDHRSLSKGLNFGAIFGCQPTTLIPGLKAGGFTIEDCEELIKLAGRVPELNERIMKMSGKESPEDSKFFVASNTLIENFFNGYKGLKERITREKSFALKHKYVRNWHGGVRWLPELAYMNYDPVTQKAKAGDKKYYSQVWSHLMNTCANTAIQSGEAVVVFGTWIMAMYYMEKWHLKSWCFNSVHDSIDIYLYKPEAKLVMCLLDECSRFVRYPFGGIFHGMDAEVSALNTYEQLSKTLYKHGEEINMKNTNLQKELEAYNAEHGTDWKFEGCFI